MKLDTLLRQHADAAHQTVKEAQPPALPRTTHSIRRSWPIAVGVASATVAVAAVGAVVLLLAGPTGDQAPGRVLQFPSTTLTSNEEDGGVAVVTTMAVPSRLEPAGVALQDAILADEIVTQEEYVRGIAAFAECLTEHGVAGVKWSVEEDGSGWSMEYGSAGEPADAHDTTYSLCWFSYIDRVLTSYGEARREG
jgi:hypothetical protein